MKTIDWSQYSAHELYEASKTMPRVAGPWTGDGGMWYRHCLDFPVAQVDACNCDGTDIIVAKATDFLGTYKTLQIAGLGSVQECKDKADAELLRIGFLLDNGH